MELEILLKIILAATLGGLIGLEREIAQKEAGLRTNILIAIGSALLTILSIKLAESFSLADPSRIASQIVTGIGFLGAGAIIQARFAVHGLTTAATIWSVAAIGMAVGIGYYFIAFTVTLFILIILTSFRAIIRMIEKQKKSFVYIIKTGDRAAILAEIKKIMTESGIRYINVNLSKIKQGYLIEIVLTTSDIKNREFVEKVIQLKGVKEISSESL
ncbi:MAG: MgtC/SapB family protein [Candidatus Aminicenantes bacterium]|nr:MgtC/SapB family protein [Candidatus Aminicenantes bacterium]